MKVRIDRIRKGVFLPRAKNILGKMSYMGENQCNLIVDDMSLRDIPITLALRGPFSGPDWYSFNDIFEFSQVPIKSEEWDNEELDEDEEEDPTIMQLFCITTEARTGHKYEILILATTKEIALEQVHDPAVVKSINIVPGPFTNGTVLSTKLIS